VVSLVKTFKRPLTYFHPPERKSVLRIFHNVWPRLAEIADAQGKRSWNFIPILHTLKTTNLNSSVFWASLLPVEIGKASWYHHGLWFCAILVGALKDAASSNSYTGFTDPSDQCDVCWYSKCKYLSSCLTKCAAWPESKEQLQSERQGKGFRTGKGEQNRKCRSYLMQCDSGRLYVFYEFYWIYLSWICFAIWKSSSCCKNAISRTYFSAPAGKSLSESRCPLERQQISVGKQLSVSFLLSHSLKQWALKGFFKEQEKIRWIPKVMDNFFRLLVRLCSCKKGSMQLNLFSNFFGQVLSSPWGGMSDDLR